LSYMMKYCIWRGFGGGGGGGGRIGEAEYRFEARSADGVESRGDRCEVCRRERATGDGGIEVDHGLDESDAGVGGRGEGGVKRRCGEIGAGVGKVDVLLVDEAASGVMERRVCCG